MKIRLFTACALFCVISSPHLLHGEELSGYIMVEGSLFPQSPLYSEQKRNDLSIAIEPEYYHEFENGSSFTFTPFFRADSADSERSHFDVREMSYLWVNDYVELQAGISKVFWGATEFVHLVDIINQTDTVESPNMEKKLGQPMVHLSVPSQWGVFEFFVLPYFRERTFPGKNGRLRGEFPVAADNAAYESSGKEHHIDYAARYSHTIGDVDLGISRFDGTGRDPSFYFSGDKLLPVYEQISQTSLDLQFVAGEWLFKLEALHRAGMGNKNYYAATGGFEFTFIGVGESSVDLGILAEYAFDEREKSVASPYDNDIMLGFRLTMNDADSSDLLAGLVHDIDSSSEIFLLEGSRRLSDNVKASIELWSFINESVKDPAFYLMRNDDFVKAEIYYYF